LLRGGRDISGIILIQAAAKYFIGSGLFETEVSRE